MSYGPAYSKEIDQPRLSNQMARIKHYMLGVGWRTLREIEEATGYPQASISAQCRHLRKAKFGGYEVKKRRRTAGTWEYLIRARPKIGEQTTLL